MSRYVDINRLEPQQFENSEVELGVLAYDYEAVQSEPYIDIVRCQDCRHWVYNFNGCKRNPCTEPWYATDFCNYGEREGE